MPPFVETRAATPLSGVHLQRTMVRGGELWGCATIPGA